MLVSFNKLSTFYSAVFRFKKKSFCVSIYATYKSLRNLCQMKCLTMVGAEYIIALYLNLEHI